jgi:hypothetical protein
MMIFSSGKTNMPRSGGRVGSVPNSSLGALNEVKGITVTIARERVRVACTMSDDPALLSRRIALNRVK